MSRFGIDITRQQDRPLKGRALVRRNSALHSARGQIFEPEVIEVTGELEQMLESRIQSVLDGRVSAKTLREIAEEGWAKARRA